MTLNRKRTEAPSISTLFLLVFRTSTFASRRGSQRVTAALGELTETITPMSSSETATLVSRAQPSIGRPLHFPKHSSIGTCFPLGRCRARLSPDRPRRQDRDADESEVRARAAAELEATFQSRLAIWEHLAGRGVTQPERTVTKRTVAVGVATCESCGDELPDDLDEGEAVEVGDPSLAIC